MVTKSPSSQQRKTRERPEKNSKPKSRKETGTLSAVELTERKRYSKRTTRSTEGHVKCQNKWSNWTKDDQVSLSVKIKGFLVALVRAVCIL